MVPDGSTVDLLHWLENQGVAVAVLAFFLLRLDTTLRTVADQQRQILERLAGKGPASA